MLSTDRNKKIDKSFFCWCCEENVNYIWRPGLHRLALPALFSTSWAFHLTAVIQLWVDLSRIPVNKGIKSSHGWTKYNDLYEIVHPSLNLIFLCLLTAVECGKGLLGKKGMIFVFLHLCFLSPISRQNSSAWFLAFSSQKSGGNFSYEPKAKLVLVIGPHNYEDALMLAMLLYFTPSNVTGTSFVTLSKHV